MQESRKGKGEAFWFLWVLGAFLLASAVAVVVAVTAGPMWGYAAFAAVAAVTLSVPLLQLRWRKNRGQA
jgi:hypothetical protein